MASPLIAAPPAPQSPVRSVVRADGWWPDIDCNAMRDALRLGDVVTHARLVAEVEAALVAVDGELAAWRSLREAEGFAALADIEPARTVGDQTRLELLFTRAVRFTAGAALAELYRDAAATTEALDRADAELQTAADYRRQATWAIRDILGVTRTAVELL